MAPSYGQKREGPKHHPGLSTLSKRLSNPCSHQVGGHAERVAALYLSSRAPICRRPSRWVSTRLMTTGDFVNELRSMKVTPHVAQNTDRARRRSMAVRRATHRRRRIVKADIAIANISLSVRADDKSRHSALFFNVPLGMNMSWQRGCRVCCI